MDNITESNKVLNGAGQLSDNGSFLYPADKELTGEDLRSFIEYHHQSLVPGYQNLLKEYLGKHPIFDKPKKGDLRPDNRVMANLSKYVVETFNGYFIGVPPNVTLTDEKDNEELQKWLDINSFQDKLSEVSRQCDIYGRSIVFAYQDEESHTKTAYCNPETSFMIYDDTIEQRPIAFVRYSYDNNSTMTGSVYFTDESYSFDDSAALLEQNATPNPFKMIPAVEFSSNAYKQSLIENIKPLNDSLDNVLSQKANQNEYFDNAYLKVMGVTLPEDEDGNPIFDLGSNKVFYSPEAESAEGVIDFIEKPDGDTMQEHLIDRLTNFIYQTSMVANLNDQSFSGNSSGVALKYKLLPMKNMAANKERKFSQSLRTLFRVLFAPKTIISKDDGNAWKDAQFKFYRNLPVNAADEANTARMLSGIVSKETQLSTLSFVDDPKKEIDRMNEEQKTEIKNNLSATDNLTDQQKGE